MSHLYTIFEEHQGRQIVKWTHYFPVYEKHFSAWVNKPVVFLEIGVFRGGSLQMWRKYFGPLATIVGIDILPECDQYEEPGINIRIGDQSDPVFLQSLVDEFGPFDIIIDDGSHTMDHQRVTMEFMYSKMTRNGCYLVEDIHTSYNPFYGGGYGNPNAFVNHTKHLIDQLNADTAQEGPGSNSFTKETMCMSFYDSMVVFDRGVIPRKEPCYGGKQN